MHRLLLGLAMLLALLCGCTSPPLKAAVSAADDGDLLIVAVHEHPEIRAAPGASPRADSSQDANSDRARALALEVARDHGLSEISAWTIDALALRCTLYRVPAGADRAVLIARLTRDPRVQLAQPLNRFEVLSDAGYNDPYFGLQRGFASINAATAQRWSRGERVRVAVIDTAVDADHPDFAGRVTIRRDFVGGVAGPGEQHGTQVAGVIAAAANNGLGIVGIAPLAEVLSYRACWVAAPATPARCNSFTLAQALGAAITAGAQVINLSLGGPRDALLERLTEHAIGRGTIVVGALPPSGRADGFPAAVPGVISVASAEEAGSGGATLAAPGRDILTLQPGGSYGFASGSSLAAAHVSGAVALLRSLDGRLRAAELQQLLRSAGGTGIDLCQAVRRLGHGGPDACSALPASASR